MGNDGGHTLKLPPERLVVARCRRVAKDNERGSPLWSCTTLNFRMDIETRGCRFCEKRASEGRSQGYGGTKDKEVSGCEFVISLP